MIVNEAGPTVLFRKVMTRAAIDVITEQLITAQQVL
jgi:hypothetical protein